MERPDGSFMAENFGGNKDDYDVIKHGNVLAGNATAYNSMRSIASSGTYEQLKQIMDVENYADSLLSG